MKKALIILTSTFLFAISVSAQTTLTKPLYEKKVVNTPGQMVKLSPAKPAAAPAKVPPPINTDIQTASVAFTSGDDGKDGDTQIGMALWDNSKRAAANYYMSNGWLTGGGNAEEYYTGSTVTVPMKVEASVPTGEIKNVGSLPLPVLRMANVNDFSNGGEVRINIKPNGHDTWKIQHVTLHFSFNNDPASPRTITWNNITLSQNSTYADLMFDKNFNPIQ